MAKSGLSSMSLIPAVFNSALRPAWVFVRDRAGYLLFERRQGISTGGRVDLEELGLADRDRLYYKPSHWLTLRRVLRQRDVRKDDVFIDFGSGKGRVVLEAAARYPFKRVIGVELSEELNAVARRNLEKLSGRLICPDVQLVTSDALEYQVPDDVTIAYFYNPFTGATFASVMDRLVRSLDRNPRRVRIVYGNPVEHDTIMATGRARLVKKARGLRPTRDWSRSNATYVYDLLPLAETSGISTSAGGSSADCSCHRGIQSS